MRKAGLILGILAVFLTFASSVDAASIIMEGDYVRTAVSDNGTLGFGSTTSPGLLHDPTGTGSFGVDDYLTPGTPWEIFSVDSVESGLRFNNNTATSTGPISQTSFLDYSSSSVFDNHVIWEGLYSDLFEVKTDYFFNDGDERINMKTTITALQDLTGLKFLRAIDPDPDVESYGSYFTVNGRGYDANTDGDFNDSGDLAPNDWVHSEGTSTGLTLGLYSVSGYTHNTGVSNYWSEDPDFYLAGTDHGDGDYTIGLAFNFGDVSADSSVVFDYAYIMGESIDDIDIPDDDPEVIPEPATMFLMGSGLFGLFGVRRRKR